MFRAIGVVAVAVLAALGYFGWKATRIVPGPGVEALVRPECGHDWPAEVTIGLIQPTADIPEFHDCQRFIVEEDRARVYGPMAAIFASPQLKQLEAQLSSAASAPGDSGVTGRTPNPLTPGVPQVSSAVPIGVIYADGRYDPLGIQTGLNCLYIYYTTLGGPDTTWSARMVPEADADGCPIRSAPSVATYTDLEIKREVVRDPQTGQEYKADDDYPPVARWDWDPKNEQQYVSIYCGYAWCEIGRPGFSQSPPLQPRASDDTPRKRRVLAIKGWYDRQYLARFDATGKLVPTEILATIVPDPDLSKVTVMPDWVHAGDVWLESSSDADKEALKEYEKKFAFKKTQPDKPSEIFIRDPGKSEQAEQFWEAKLTAAGWSIFNDKRRRVKFRKLKADYEVPGVVRWRWMTLDEGTWARCPYGCCEISYY